MANDGSIRIGTELDNSSIPNDLKELKEMVAKGGEDVTEEFAYKVKDLENKWSGLKNKQEETTASIVKYKQQLEEVADLQTEISNLKVSKSIDEESLAGLKAEYTSNPSQANQSAMKDMETDIELSNSKVIELESNLARLGDSMTISQKLERANQKLSDIDVKIDKIRINVSKLLGRLNAANTPLEKTKVVLSSIVGSLGKAASSALKFGKNMAVGALHSAKAKASLGGGLKNLAKYGAMLIGIRSIYAGIRSLSSAWLSNGTAAANQTKANLDYLKSALANAVGPLIQWITNLLAMAVGYAGGLIKALTGIDIFAGATKSGADSLSSAAKSAKEIKKQLAGFDEMNVLSNDSSSDSDSGSGGTATVQTDLDLTGLGNWKEIIDVIKKAWANADFTEVGIMVGEKLNDALKSINWTDIKKTTAKIAKSIVTFLNGFIYGTDWNLVGHTIAEMLNTVLEFLYTAVTYFDWGALGGAIASALQTLIQDIDWGKLGGTIGNFFLGVLKGLNGFIKQMDWNKLGKDLWNALVQFITNVDWAGLIVELALLLVGAVKGAVELALGFFGEIFSGIGTYFSEKMEECGGDIAFGLLKGILDGIIGIGTWLYDNLVAPIIDGVKELFGIHSPSTIFAEIGTNLIEGLMEGISSLFSAVLSLLQEIYDGICNIFADIGTWFKEKFESAVTGIQEVFSNIGAWFGEKYESIKTVFSNVGTWFKEKFESAIKGIKEVFSTIGTWFGEKYEAIKTVFSNVGTWFKEKFDTAWTNIKNTFSLTNIKTFFSDVLTGIKNIFTSIPDWFKTKFSEAWTNVKNVFSSGGQIFDGIKDGILSGLKEVINGLIGGINKVVKIPFDGINTALKTIKDVSILGFKPFSWLGTISVPQIPKLATGTYATSPMYAQIAEQGKEAVVPLENNTQWAKDFLDVLDSYGGFNSGGAPRIIQLIVNGKLLKDIIDEEDAKENYRRNGKGRLRYG